MRLLEKCCSHYGRFLARHPAPFLVLPLLTTLVSTLGLFNFHSEDNIWDLYSPLNGFCRAEERALERFEYASSVHHYRLQILVNRKDDGSLMNTNDINEMLAMHSFVLNNITVNDDANHYTYRDLCGIYCNESNTLVLAFIQAVIDTKGESSSIIFTYPLARALQRHLFVGYSVGNIHWSQDDPTLVDSFKLFIFHFMVNLDMPNGRMIAKNFESQLRSLFTAASYESKNLEYALLSRDRELEEQRKITLVSIPYLGVTAAVLTAFMIISLVNFPIYKSQHIEAIFGVISPSMALVTSAGFLWGFGYPFSNILTVVPFLVITIGVDDAFLILSGWRHSSSSKNLEDKMSETLSKSGASIMITSLTDILCFAVGLFSNLPVVQLFCLYTFLALTVDFIYQMTFFTAIVVYRGKWQIRYQEEYFKKDKQKGRNSDKKSLSNKDKVHGTGVTAYSLSDEALTNGKYWNKKISSLQLFIKFLYFSITKFTVISLFIVHIVASVYICTKVNTDFDMENLYMRDSPLKDISQKMQNYVLKEAYVVYFSLYPMPNLADTFVRDQFDKLVDELESIPKFGRGPDGTDLWTREFADAIAFWGDEQDFWRHNQLLSFFREYGMDEKFITTEIGLDGTEEISGFFWTITYHNMKNFLDVQKLMQQRRAIISKYSDLFNVSSYHPLEKVPTESAGSAPSNFLQTAVSAVILMTLLVYIFISDIFAVISVAISIISICIGTLAYLHVWNVHLDAISLISMLMSVGFSVDYSAHICYHYFIHKDGKIKRSNLIAPSISIIIGSETSIKNQAIQVHDIKEFDSKSRLKFTLQSVGWPVVQSGLSTLLGMVPLIVVQAYVVAVFWKTVILVTVLGMLHALVLLPVLFLVFNDVARCVRRIYK